MPFEATVDDARPTMDHGHPTIIIAYYEPMALVSLKWYNLSEIDCIYYFSCASGGSLSTLMNLGNSE